MLTLWQLQSFCRSTCLAKHSRFGSGFVSGQKRGPWNFKSATYNSQKFTGDIPSRLRKEELAKAAEHGHVFTAFELVTKWKRIVGFTPDLDIYNSLLNACADCALPNEARAVFADMLLMGVKPDIHSFVHLLVVCRFHHHPFIFNQLHRLRGSVLTIFCMKFST